MGRSRPHGRSKSDHRVCQAARHARAAEYRERINISAEQQEARIAAVNAECDVEDAPRRRRRQKSTESKAKAGAARVSAGGRSRKASGSAKKKAKKGLEHALGKAAERDPHALHCHQCGATAVFGLRGGKEGGEVRYFCRGHVHKTGCFRIDGDRGDWAVDRGMRGLRAEERRLEEELRNLGGPLFAAEPVAEQPSGPPCASAPWNEFQSTGDWVSMLMSRSLIAMLLTIGGIESNPGPLSNEEEIEACRRSWEEANPRIGAMLLAYLAKEKVHFADWGGKSLERRLAAIDKYKKAYEEENVGAKWASGWDDFLENAGAAGGGGQSARTGPSTDVEMREANQDNQSRRSYDTFVDPLGAKGEGISKRRAKGGIFTPRTETVHKILSRLQETLVLLLASTPCSGKTSICQLVYEEARKSRVYESEDVIYVNCAEVGSGGKSFEDVFLEQARTSFSEASKSPPSSPDKQPLSDASSSSSQAPQRKKKLIILDEVQTTYDKNSPGHSLLWPLLKRLLATNQGHVNFLLTASRGSNPAAEGLPSTPWVFSDDQRIPLRPRPDHPVLVGSDIPEPALQFTMDEYWQLCNSFCKSIGFGGDQQQLQTLYDVIEATTERHPGSVLHVLDLLKGHSPSNYAGRVAEWAANEVEFVTSPRLLDSLSGARSFPIVDKFWRDKRAIDLISKLVASGGKKNLTDIRKDFPDCADKAEALAKWGYMLMEQDVVSFTSSLHMHFYRYNLTRRKWVTPNYVPGTLETFLAEALTKMHPPALQHSLNVSTRGGVLGGVLEAHFQFELYSAITSLLPEGDYLSPTVGKVYGLEAYVDFVLHGSRKWAFELLVDGRNLREHERRFEPNGRYHPMVLGKQIDAWIVVDLRNPKTSKPRRARGPGVCHVFFDSAYELATIDFGSGNEQQVVLTGRA